MTRGKKPGGILSRAVVIVMRSDMDWRGIVAKLKKGPQGLRSPCAQAAGRGRAGDEGPRRGKDLLTLQPKPILTLVAHVHVGPGAEVTAVARVWPPGRTRQCRLCRECSASHLLGVCLVATAGTVARESAALLTDGGLGSPIEVVRVDRLAVDEPARERARIVRLRPSGLGGPVGADPGQP